MIFVKVLSILSDGMRPVVKYLQENGNYCIKALNQCCGIVGKPIKEPDCLSIMDTAPTTASLLGAEIPKEWEGAVIQ